MAKIGIIISSTRDNRFGDKMAAWVYEAAARREGLEAEIVDLRDYDLPFFNEVASNAWVPTQNPEGVRWQQKVAEFDGYIFVTAEYNRSIPAALKNAIDFAYNEWNRKPAAYVGYGSVGGARAVEHLRQISVELQMAPLRSGVHLQGADFMAVAMQGEKDLASLDYMNEGLETLLDELVWWTAALKSAREEQAREKQAA